ncbi:hypothetical protein AB6G16_16525 [Proteus mirabilis]
MELEIQVTFRTGDSIRTRRYKSEQGALRGIWKWLNKHQEQGDIQASFFSPNRATASLHNQSSSVNLSPKP